MFWCFIFWDWRYPLIISSILLSQIIYRHHFLFKLGTFSISSTHWNFCFFETCGFSYTTQTLYHSGGTTSSLYFFNRSWNIEDNVQLGWGGELRKEVLLLMLSYFGNLVVFCLILKFFKFLFYSPWLLRKNFQNEKGEIEFLSFYLT